MTTNFVMLVFKKSARYTNTSTFEYSVSFAAARTGVTKVRTIPFWLFMISAWALYLAFAVSFFFVYLVKHLNLYSLQRFVLVYILRNSIFTVAFFNFKISFFLEWGCNKLSKAQRFLFHPCARRFCARTLVTKMIMLKRGPCRLQARQTVRTN